MTADVIYLAGFSDDADHSKEALSAAREEAVAEAREAASQIEGVAGPDDANIREVVPDADLVAGADSTWNGTSRQWLQAGLTGGQVNVVYDISSGVGNAAERKVIVFYAIQNVTVDPVTSEVEFRDGTGSTFARLPVQLAQVEAISPIVLLDELIKFGATDDGAIAQWAETDGDANIVFRAIVVEPLGETLTTHDTTPEMEGR